MFLFYCLEIIDTIMKKILKTLQRKWTEYLLENWKQNQGIEEQLINYRISLLSELDKDLVELDKIDTVNEVLIDELYLISAER